MFHRQRLFVSFVIVTDQMQETVHGKMGEMMGERLTFGAGLPRDGLKGKDDVAEMALPAAFFVGNDSTFVAASTPRQSRLSCANCRIIGQNDSKLRPPC